MCFLNADMGDIRNQTSPASTVHYRPNPRDHQDLRTRDRQQARLDRAENSRELADQRESQGSMTLYMVFG